MNTEKIYETIKENADEFEFWGIHVDDRKFETGEILPNSYEKYQDDPCDESYEYDKESGLWIGRELDGTSCVAICDTWDNYSLDDVKKALDITKLYNYDHCYLVASDVASKGNDINEYVIENAKVIEIL